MVGAMPHELFDSADGATLFAAMILFPVSISFRGGTRMVMTGYNKYKRSREQLREEIRNEGRKEGRKEERKLALRADKEKRDDETLEQAMERLRGSNRS